MPAQARPLALKSTYQCPGADDRLTHQHGPYSHRERPTARLVGALRGLALALILFGRRTVRRGALCLGLRAGCGRVEQGPGYLMPPIWPARHLRWPAAGAGRAGPGRIRGDGRLYHVHVRGRMALQTRAHTMSGEAEGADAPSFWLGGPCTAQRAAWAAANCFLSCV